MSTRIAQLLWGSAAAQPSAPCVDAPAGLPARVGIRLTPGQFREVLEIRPKIGFIGVQAENWPMDHRPFHVELDRLRALYPVALHGVVLAIGAERPLDEARLVSLIDWIERYEPASIAGHLVWSNDLPRHRQTMARVCEHIDLVQNRLQRRILLENPSVFSGTSTMSESGFLREVVARTGCGLLLDLSSAHEACAAHRCDVIGFIDDLPLDAVGEIRLSGFAAERLPPVKGNGGSAIDPAVWSLYARVIARVGSTPTLLECVNDVPSLPILLADAGRAESMMAKRVTPRTCGIYWGCA